MTKKERISPLNVKMLHRTQYGRDVPSVTIVTIACGMIIIYIFRT